MVNVALSHQQMSYLVMNGKKIKTMGLFFIGAPCRPTWCMRCTQNKFTILFIGLSLYWVGLGRVTNPLTCRVRSSQENLESAGDGSQKSDLCPTLHQTQWQIEPICLSLRTSVDRRMWDKRSSPIAEGPREALVSRNPATTKHLTWKPYRVALFAWFYV